MPTARTRQFAPLQSRAPARRAAPFRRDRIAYACWTAGMRLADKRPVTGPLRRWVRLEVPEG
ncbi:hypothetical protein BKD26_08105 [Streptomyces sp. CB03238]|nr:hypothetical protein BKD26_08105 [Streptomyces sp. CB03238]